MVKDIVLENVKIIWKKQVNLLASVVERMKKLVKHGEKYPNDERVKRLVKNFNPKYPNTLTSEFTAHVKIRVKN